MSKLIRYNDNIKNLKELTYVPTLGVPSNLLLIQIESFSQSYSHEVYWNIIGFICYFLYKICSINWISRLYGISHCTLFRLWYEIHRNSVLEGNLMYCLNDIHLKIYIKLDFILALWKYWMLLYSMAPRKFWWRQFRFFFWTISTWRMFWFCLHGLG